MNEETTPEPKAQSKRLTPALNKALAAVQKELPKVNAGQTADAGSYSYKYADLADINPLIMPLLGRNGLAWVTRPTWEDGGFFLRYELRHESGQMLSGLYPLHFAGGPQAVGKEITYARRYALCAVTGIAASGDDDDGASAQQAAEETPRPAPAKRAAKKAPAKPEDSEDKQRKLYHVLRDQLGWDEEAGHDFIDEVSNGRAHRWTDLGTVKQRGAVLDAMQDKIDELAAYRRPGVDTETGEVLAGDAGEGGFNDDGHIDNRP